METTLSSTREIVAYFFHFPQVYRHVDNVMFENSHLVENFLNYWRSTGHQRIGYLYGKYEGHTDVPLGIRATVVAIYEPPQVNFLLNVF